MTDPATSIAILPRAVAPGLGAGYAVPAASKQAVAGSTAQTTPEDSVTLSPQAKAIVAKLQARDTAVRAHEQAHVAAGGNLITSAVNFTYEKGPDGRMYAVGGDVGIDTSPVAGDPQATVAKAQQIEAAALAPADPSGQDEAVAASAASMAAQALAQEGAKAGASGQAGAKADATAQGGAGASASKAVPGALFNALG